MWHESDTDLWINTKEEPKQGTLPADDFWGTVAQWAWWASLRGPGLPFLPWSWLRDCVWGDSRTSEAECARECWRKCDCDSSCEPATGRCVSWAETGCGSDSGCVRGAWLRRLAAPPAPPAPLWQLCRFLLPFTCCCVLECGQEGRAVRQAVSHTHMYKSAHIGCTHMQASRCTQQHRTWRVRK